jgi:hypothetical protein
MATVLAVIGCALAGGLLGAILGYAAGYGWFVRYGPDHLRNDADLIFTWFGAAAVGVVGLIAGAATGFLVFGRH